MNLNFDFDASTLLKNWWKIVKENFITIQDSFNQEVSDREDSIQEHENAAVLPHPDGCVTIAKMSSDAFDEEPTNDSQNLVKSGALKKYIDDNTFHVNESIGHIDLDSMISEYGTYGVMCNTDESETLNFPNGEMAGNLTVVSVLDGYMQIFTSYDTKVTYIRFNLGGDFDDWVQITHLTDEAPTKDSENIVLSGAVYQALINLDSNLYENEIKPLDEALARKIEDVAYGSPGYSPSAELVELFSSNANGNKSIWVDDACDFFAYRCFDTNQRLGIVSDGGEIYRNSFYVAISTSRFDWTNNKIRIFDILPQLYNNSVVDTHIHVRAGYLSEDGQYMQTDNPIGAYLDGMELFLMSNYSEADYIVVMGYVDTSIYGVNMNGVREIN